MTQEQLASDLLWPLWRCTADDYKDRYKREIWDHFENAVRSAAYTGSLKRYLENFQSRLPVEIQAQYIKPIMGVINCGLDTEVLTWLRDETKYMVMLVRLENQTRREDYLAAHQPDPPFEHESIENEPINPELE